MTHFDAELCVCACVRYVRACVYVHVCVCACVPACPRVRACVNAIIAEFKKFLLPQEIVVEFHLYKIGTYD